MIIDERIVLLAKDIYTCLGNNCVALYLGGSRCQEYIENMHDYDLICFVNKPIDMCHLKRVLDYYKRKNNLDDESIDLFQSKCSSDGKTIQSKPKQIKCTQYGIYSNCDLQLIVGDKIEFTFDPIKKNRKEFIKLLYDTVTQLDTDESTNQKRWYQVFRCYFIVKNKTYELTDDEKMLINLAHDLKSGTECLKNEVREWLARHV